MNTIEKIVSQVKKRDDDQMKDWLMNRVDTVNGTEVLRRMMKTVNAQHRKEMGARGMAQWHGTCLANTRSELNSPYQKQSKTKPTNQRNKQKIRNEIHATGSSLTVYYQLLNEITWEWTLQPH